MNMHHRKAGLASTLVKLLGAAALMVGVMAGQQAMAGIANTKHNLSSSGSGPNKSTATDQICVFCHTPHGSDTGTSGNPVAVPLWNKKLPSSGQYTTYDQLNTSSLDGKILTVGSVSLACLSCHDGTQAMDNMLNAPGSGGYNAAGASLGGLTGSSVDANGKMVNATGAPIPMLGTDLRNDHPIGIQYCGGGLTGSGTAVSGSCKDSDFETTKVKTASVNSNQIFWIDLNGNGTREKTDIALYTRDFGTGYGVGPSVECASCHDPHVESKNSAGNEVMFMRVTTAQSQICLSCHTK